MRMGKGRKEQRGGKDEKKREKGADFRGKMRMRKVTKNHMGGER